MKLIRLTVLFACSLAGSTALADPASSWVVQSTLDDCSGPPMQETTACENYAADLYEHLDYDMQSASTADIRSISAGYDDDYYYFEYDFQSGWNKNQSTGNSIGLEVDIDPNTESNRADYYIGVFQKDEFNSNIWVDAYAEGGFNAHVDNNNDVGGADPLVSDYGGTEGDGYEGDLPQAADRVWARIRNGNFQIAIRRSYLGDPEVVYFRPWSRQSTSIAKDKLYFHDHAAVSDVDQIDNACGVPFTTCLGAGPSYSPANLLVLKSSSAVRDPSGAAAPAAHAIPGAVVEYSVTISNSGTADATDVIVTDTLAGELVFLAGEYNGGASDVEITIGAAAPIYCIAEIGSDSNSDGCFLNATGDFLTVGIPAGGSYPDGIVVGTTAPNNSATVRFRATIQ